MRKWRRRAIAALLLTGLVLLEIRASLLQSWFFTSTNERLFYELAEGKNPNLALPRPAPYDERRGYSKIAVFQARLESQGYEVTRQARQSETMVELIRRGISPPYPEAAGAGIDIRGQDGRPLFRYAQSDFLFEKLEDIPPLLIRTLLFLENRDLDSPDSPWQNPAIEWERLIKAAFLYVGSKLFLPVSVQGGSTLAVQLEKFRHSPHGRTDSPLEKLRQLIGASLKAYREGANTRRWRNRIIVDYLNSVPLAAAPGYGEIHGIGEGLHAWFGLDLKEVVAALKKPGAGPEKARAYKHVLTLLIAVRAPSVFLVEERDSLEEKVGQFTRLMARAGVIDWELAAAVQGTPIQFLPAAPLAPQPSSVKNKAANSIRTALMELLGVTNLYDLNRLDLQVASTIDVPLQKYVTDFLHSLADRETVQRYNLNGERLLEGKDPRKVIYSFLLVEPTPAGNLVRVQADNLPGPLDFNKSVKLELGSTAKLRTLTHYLEIMAELHRELKGLDPGALRQRAQNARDPLTRWAAASLQEHQGLELEPFLELALERKYSASPHEDFFTGGGLHRFENFDPDDDRRIPTLREAFRNSTNLVFIRLMRDLVSYHRARLPYDADAVLSDPEHPERLRLLREIAEEESRGVLRRSYQLYQGAAAGQIVERLLGQRRTARHLAILFFAWKIGSDEPALAAWLSSHGESHSARVVSELFRSYSNPRLNLSDYGYLLSVHPLELWCAGMLARKPTMSWQELYEASAEARRVSSGWLLQSRNRRPQDLRLRIRAERDAFARMTPYWQRLGFPFKTMVPSYATAIGNSSDRPVALAELLGILVNDGERLRRSVLDKIHFAPGTPYETVFEQQPKGGERVLAPEVARAVRRAMAEVVEHGTARRLKGVFRLRDGRLLVVGGKTGSGDNRYETFNRHGAVTSSRPTNRTAAFVFYIGKRYFGVVTAYVQGQEAGDYHFTSALPVTILKLLAPAILAVLDGKAPPADLRVWSPHEPAGLLHASAIRPEFPPRGAGDQVPRRLP
ncbi:MAG TPA: transglycosylase domain-containing protein [candidate division Zixibacteria bacterium]|nr:transglycosylase domain-containing protein [candidate division Zixibacteria bacterium]